MVVAAVRCVGEGDHLSRAIGQAQAQHLLTKCDHARHVRGKAQDMRQVARSHRRDPAAAGGRTRASRHRGHRTGDRLGRGRGLGRHHQLRGDAVGVTQPQAVAPRDACGQRVRLNGQTQGLDARLEHRQILGKDAVADVLQLLAVAALVDGGPAMRVAVGVEIQALAVLPDIQAKGRVEAVRLGQIRHSEHKAVHGMRSDDARATARRKGGCHVWVSCCRFLPGPGPRAGTGNPSANAMVKIRRQCRKMVFLQA
jgi:hypothetical protein